VDQNNNIRRSKSQVAATPGQAAITEAAVLQAALRIEVEVAIAAEVVARVSKAEEAAVAEVKEEDVVAVAGTEASMPMSRKETKAMGAWSTEAMMRYAAGATWWIGGRDDCVAWTYPKGRIRVSVHLSTLMYFSHRLYLLVRSSVPKFVLYEQFFKVMHALVE
jgi:hypothetical protein